MAPPHPVIIMSPQPRVYSKLLIIAECFTLVTTVFAVVYLVYSIDWMNQRDYCGRTGELISYVTAVAASFNLAFMLSTMIGILIFRYDNKGDNLHRILFASSSIALLTSFCLAASTLYVLIFYKFECRAGRRIRADIVYVWLTSVVSFVVNVVFVLSAAFLPDEDISTVNHPETVFHINPPPPYSES